MPISRRLMRPGGRAFYPQQAGTMAAWLDASSTDAMWVNPSGPVYPPTTSGWESLKYSSDCWLWISADDPANVISSYGTVISAKDRSPYNFYVADIGNNGQPLPQNLQPKLILNAINGKPAFRFSGGQGFYLPNGQAQSLSGNVAYVFAVVRIAASNLFARVFSCNDGDGTENALLTNSNAETLAWYASDYGTFDAPLSGFDRFAIVKAVNDGSLSYLRNNGGAISSTNGSQSVFVSGPQDLGVGWSPSSSADFFVGDICELIVFGGTVGAADQDRIERYLADKYGIPQVHSSVVSDRLAAATPLQFGGCVGWYDASDSATMFDNSTIGSGSQVLPNGSVARWMDKSPHGNHLSQVTPSTRPTLIANAINGRPVVRFDGSDGLQATMAGGSFQYNSYTVFAVLKINVAVNNARILSFADSGSNDFAAGNVIPCVNSDTNANNLAIFSGTTNGNLQTVTGFASYAIFTGRCTQGSVVNYANGVAPSAASTVAISRTVNRMAVGGPAQGLGNPAGSLNGDIAELIIFNTALTPGERSKVERYLADKYAISGVPYPTPPVGYIRNLAVSASPFTQPTSSSAPTVAVDSATGRVVLDMTSGGSTGGVTQTLKVNKPASTFVGNATTSPSAMFAISYKPLTPGYGPAFGFATNPDSQTRIFYASDYGATPGNMIFDIGNATASTGGRLSGATTDESIANHIMVMYRNGSEMVIRQDGKQVLASYTASGTMFSPSTAADFTLNQPQTGNGRAWYNEFLSYPSVPAITKILALEKYLAAKWGVTLGPTATNQDTIDWIGRVYAAGGSVSQSTANAVNTFCNSIDATSGLRGKFLRLNLFCGTSDASLIAARTPLYRGTSRSATQNGSALDSNNLFAQTDYLEYGAGGGLSLNNSASKRLDTGLTQVTVGSTSCHLAVYETSKGSGSYRCRIGSRGATGNNEHMLTNTTTDPVVYATSGTSGQGRAASTAYSESGAFWIGTTESSTASSIYKNGVLAGTATPAARTAQALNYYVFALNDNGTAGDAMTTGTLGAYSIGLSMDSIQALAYHNAMVAFQTALNRNV